MKMNLIHSFVVESAWKREEDECFRIHRAAEKVAHIIWKYFRDAKRRKSRLILQADSKIQRLAREMLSRIKLNRAELEKTCCLIVQCFLRIMLAKCYVRMLLLTRAAEANTYNHGQKSWIYVRRSINDSCISILQSQTEERIEIVCSLE